MVKKSDIGISSFMVGPWHRRHQRDKYSWFGGSKCDLQYDQHSISTCAVLQSFAVGSLCRSDCCFAAGLLVEGYRTSVGRRHRRGPLVVGGWSPTSFDTYNPFASFFPNNRKESYGSADRHG
jgi:hypothetical protein